MSILESINAAKGRQARAKSQSQIEWEAMEEADRDAVRTAILEGSIGPGKMATILRENGVKISRHFLEMIQRGEVA